MATSYLVFIVILIVLYRVFETNGTLLWSPKVCIFWEKSCRSHEGLLVTLNLTLRVIQKSTFFNGIF